MTRDFAVPVLMYHRVCDLTEAEERNQLVRDLTVSPADFEAQVKYLRDTGFTFLHISEIQDALRNGQPLPVKAVAITLDDGYRDNFTHAFPILEKYGAKATVFMVTNNFGRPARLSWDDARAMNARAVAFESHSVSHPDLTTVSNEQLRTEVVDSKSILERGLGQRITSLAYPAGAFDSRVELALQAAGYDAGWKKGGGAVLPSDRNRPYQLPRIRVHGRTDLEKFIDRVESGVRQMAMRRTLHATG